MRSKALVFGCFVTLFVLVTSIFAQDQLTGNWSGDWGPSARDRNPVTLALKWDGKALTGNVTGGEGVNGPIPVQKGTFDPKTGKVHMETDAKNERTGQTVHFIIDGTVEKGAMTGTWNHDNRKGDFKLTKK
jgi:hypothetical protein